ncbi:MAG: protein-glutamate O-methyltransferase CheR [Aquificaceae bacterium]|nr:protein-glutamate O-methyltransferase CheR [Aquificaceae bacterium]
MDFDRIVKIVEDRTGIAITGARLTRIRRLFEKSPDLFLGLESMPFQHENWQKVIDSLSVQETYFFRDVEVFDCVRKEILRELSKRFPSEGLKIWSAGCATGEETYTLAIVVLEYLKSLGFSFESIKDKVFILGTDISQRGIQRAREGLYKNIPMGSFRNFPEEFMKYLEPYGEGYRVTKEVRQITRFEVHNLLDSKPPIQDADLVVCRNVLIYFHDASKKRAYTNLVQALKKGGYLIMGPLENPGMGLEKRQCGRLVYYMKP